MSARQECIRVRALRTKQGKDVNLFAFFLNGADVLRIADISRIRRDDGGKLKGFQRPDIKRHVGQIVDYLDRGAVLFPNAILLAIAPGVRFVQSRGTKPDVTSQACIAGTLHLPLASGSSKAAWIVDGQQRSLALAACVDKGLQVPVVAFESQDVNVHREQFILVNKARPLPSRLVDELLPEVDACLPRDLATRRIPSVLCNMLNDSADSPFRGLISRSSGSSGDAVVTDRAVVNMIRDRINNPIGALAPYSKTVLADADAAEMYRVLVMFWSAAKRAFSNAWGLPPSESRLMHSAGIQAMGILMDRLITRAFERRNPERHIYEALSRIAPQCAWTDGFWPDLGCSWNEIECTGRGIKRLGQQLVRLDHVCAMAEAA